MAQFIRFMGGMRKLIGRTDGMPLHRYFGYLFCENYINKKIYIYKYITKRNKIAFWILYMSLLLLWIMKIDSFYIYISCSRQKVLRVDTHIHCGTLILCL